MLILFIVYGFSGIKRFNNYFECYKVCLVGDDMSQIVGVDYDETSNHVMKHATMHNILTIVLSKS